MEVLRICEDNSVLSIDVKIKRQFKETPADVLSCLLCQAPVEGSGGENVCDQYLDHLAQAHNCLVGKDLLFNLAFFLKHKTLPDKQLRELVQKNTSELDPENKDDGSSTIEVTEKTMSSKDASKEPVSPQDDSNKENELKKNLVGMKKVGKGTDSSDQQLKSLNSTTPRRSRNRHLYDPSSDSSRKSSEEDDRKLRRACVFVKKLKPSKQIFLSTSESSSRKSSVDLETLNIPSLVLAGEDTDSPMRTKLRTRKSSQRAIVDSSESSEPSITNSENEKESEDGQIEVENSFPKTRTNGGKLNQTRPKNTEEIIGTNITSSDTNKEIKNETWKYSNDFKNMSRTVCLICKLELNHDILEFHLKTTHNTSQNVYEKNYGTVNITKKIYHQCYICQKALVFTKIFLREHLKSHNTDIRTYEKELFKRSNDDKNVDHDEHDRTLPAESPLIKQSFSSNVVSSSVRILAKSLASQENKLLESHGISKKRKIDNEEVENKRRKTMDYMNSNEMKEKCRVMRHSDVVNDFSTYQCQICTFSGQYRRFLKHIDNKHKLSVSEYRRKYGELIFDELVNHSCLVCHKSLVYTWDSVFTHLKSHNMTLSHYNSSYLKRADSEGTRAKNNDSSGMSSKDSRKSFSSEDLIIENSNQHDQSCVRSESEEDSNDLKCDKFKYSDTLGNFSIYKCPICKLSFEYRKFLQHLAKDHKMKFSECKKKYSDDMFADKVMHKCKICGKDLVFAEDLLLSHLKRHRLTIKQYSDQYLLDELKEVQEVKVDIESDEAKDETILGNNCENELTVENYLEIKKAALESEPTKIIQLDDSSRPVGKSIVPYVEQKKCSKIRYSDKPYDYCTYKCPFCEICNLNKSSFSSHLTSKHKKKYSLMFGDCMFESVRHICKICKEDISYEYRDLSQHLLASHKMHIFIYVQTFLTETDDEHVSTIIPEIHLQNAENQHETTDKFKLKKTEEDNEYTDNSKKRLTKTEKEGASTDDPKKHLTKTKQEHTPTVVPKKLFTDVPRDYSTYRCNKCKFVDKLHLLEKHVRNKHRLDIFRHKKKYGKLMFKTRKYHACKVCKEVFIFDYSKIAEHLKKHDLNIPNYNKRYLYPLQSENTDTNSTNTSSETYRRRLNSTTSNSSKKSGKHRHSKGKDTLDCETPEDLPKRKRRSQRSSSEDSINSLLVEETSDTPEDLPEREKRSQRSSSGDTDNTLLDDQTTEVVDGPNWYDGNTYSCTKCSFEIFSKEIITKHIDEKHPSKYKTGKEAYKETMNEYNCKFCSMSVLHEKTALEDHLDGHFFNLESYARLYVTPLRLNSSSEEENLSRTDEQFHGFDDTELRSTRRMNRSKSQVLQKTVLGSNDRSKTPILQKSVLGSNDRRKTQVCQRSVLGSNDRSKTPILQKSVMGSNDRRKTQVCQKSVLDSNDRRNSNDLNYKPPRRSITSRESSNKEMEVENPSSKKNREATKNHVKQARRKEDISYEPNSEDSESSGNERLDKTSRPIRQISQKSYLEDNIKEEEDKVKEVNAEKKKYIEEKEEKEEGLEIKPYVQPIKTEIKVEDISCIVNPVKENRDDFTYICPKCPFQVPLKGLRDGTGSNHMWEAHSLNFIKFKNLGLRWKRVTLEAAMLDLHNPNK